MKINLYVSAFECGIYFPCDASKAVSLVQHFSSCVHGSNSKQCITRHYGLATQFLRCHWSLHKHYILFKHRSIISLSLHFTLSQYFWHCIPGISLLIMLKLLDPLAPVHSCNFALLFINSLVQHDVISHLNDISRNLALKIAQQYAMKIEAIRIDSCICSWELLF